MSARSNRPLVGKGATLMKFARSLQVDIWVQLYTLCW